MADLLSFTVGVWTIFIWKWTLGSDFPWLSKQSTPKFKFHYRKRTYETTPIFRCSQYLFREINYQCLWEKYIHNTLTESNIFIPFTYKKDLVKTLTELFIWITHGMVFTWTLKKWRSFYKKRIPPKVDKWQISQKNM